MQKEMLALGSWAAGAAGHMYLLDEGIKSNLFEVGMAYMKALFVFLIANNISPSYDLMLFMLINMLGAYAGGVEKACYLNTNKSGEDSVGQLSGAFKVVLEKGLTNEAKSQLQQGKIKLSLDDDLTQLLSIIQELRTVVYETFKKEFAQNEQANA